MRIEDEPYVKENLDAAGSLLKRPFLEVVKKTNRRYSYAFEWCAGIGEIGMELLRHDVCARLCVADINPVAIDYAVKIAQRDGLMDRIDFYVGDNMDPIPQSARFDLVVGNPPNYYNIQRNHPFWERFGNDLRPNDRGWEIHKKFYGQIRPYLTNDAVMFINEIEPFKKEVYIQYAMPYDVRTTEPIKDFRTMTQSQGLKILGTKQIMMLAGVGFYCLKIVPVSTYEQK